MKSIISAVRSVPFCVIFSVACTGTIGSTGGGGTATPGGGSPHQPDATGQVNLGGGKTCQVGAARSPIRQLTSTQYRNALVDLTGDATLAQQDFPPEAAIKGFFNNADAQNPSDTLIDALSGGAEKASASVLANRAKTIPCTTTDAACATKFIATFGHRAFRRPLTTTEQSAFETFFAARKAAADFDTAVRLTVYAMLQSPQFFYLPEFGQGSLSTTDQSKALTPSELASRIALNLTDAPPDDALLQSAESGALSQPLEIERQVRRLLATQRGEDAVAAFHAQWLDLVRLDLTTVNKNPTVFPEWNDDLKQAMRDELAKFVTETIFRGGGRLKDLFTSTDLWVNDKLAPIYKVAAPAGANFGKVSADPAQRAGIFTLSSTLADRGHASQSSPVWRGVFVLDKILCRPPGSPPKGVNTTVDDSPTAVTTGRERESAHATDPACAGCHKAIDGIGFAFENYDAIGGYRTTDNGSTIDASGTLSTSAGTIAVNGTVDLANQLSSNDDAHLCVTTQWFRSSFARLETDADACAIQSIDAAFKDGGDDVQGLLVSIAKSYAFSRVAVTN